MLSFYQKLHQSLTKGIRWAENLTLMGEKINAYRILVGKPERMK
jgi:hypothetical protein